LGYPQQPVLSGENRYVDQLDNLERARERDEGYQVGEFGGKGHTTGKIEQEIKKDERYLEGYRDPYRSQDYRGQDYRGQDYRGQDYRAQDLKNQELRAQELKGQEAFYSRGFTSQEMNRPMQGSQEGFYRQEGLIKSQLSMPGYSSGIISYQPVGTAGELRYEPRIEERAFEQQQIRPEFQQGQMYQQGFQQQSYIQQRENIPPTTMSKDLKQDLNNIEARITHKTTKKDEPLMSQSYTNQPIGQEMYRPYDQRLYQEKTSYQRPREYVPVLPEGKMSTIPVQTQLPGVISNPDARMDPMGKYVTHQGGTHSTVGSVQSHRIISRMADNPTGGMNALDEDARIALGDVPKSYYGGETTATKGTKM
jgi:hypothetical protein